MNPSLFPDHLEDLRKSGLSDQTIEAAGIFSVDRAKALELIGFDVPQLESAIVFPYNGTEGEFSRFKVFPTLKDTDGCKKKYLQGKGNGCRLYITKKIQAAIKDSTHPLAIAEGEKKTLKLIQEGVTAIGIGGVWNWRDGESHSAIADFDEIAWVERCVTFYFDSDIWSRADLLRAVYALGKELEERGAFVKVVIIPQQGENKAGIDDLLVEKGCECLKSLKEIELSHAAFKEAKSWHKRWKKKNLKEQDKKTDEQRLSQATLIVNLVEENGIKLWHSPQPVSYATVQIKEQHGNFPIRSQNFRKYLARLFFENYKQSPASQSLLDAVNTFDGMAEFDGEEHPVFTRLAKHENAIYLDLANDKWEAIEITPLGWNIVSSDKLPIKFRRVKGMLLIPHPARGGSINDLRPFVNVASDASWTMLVAWLLAVLCPTGPYPIAVFYGEQGSAKTTRAKALRTLVDPSTASLRSEPRDVRDLMIAANNGWIINFDNLSHIPPWLSDALCRLATGGGFGTRQLYSDDDEVIFEAQRPIILNGIEEFTTRPDLIDRAWIDSLPSIPENARRTEKEFWADFEIARPGILGALLDVVSGALRNLPTTHLRTQPRMADFARWVTAAEPSLGWKPGTFLATYTANRSEANELALEGSPIATSILHLAKDSSLWEGTASELLNRLEENSELKTKESKAWPKTSRNLSNALRRIAPNLRAQGIEVSFERSGKRRTIRIKSLENSGIPSSSASQEVSSVISASSQRHSEPPKIEKNDANDDDDDLLPLVSNTGKSEEEAEWRA